MERTVGPCSPSMTSCRTTHMLEVPAKAIVFLFSLPLQLLWEQICTVTLVNQIMLQVRNKVHMRLHSAQRWWIDP